MIYFRYTKFQEMAAKGELDPQKLPPTEDVASQHTLRTYLQVQQWKNLTEDHELKPTSWGWENSKGVLEPINSIKQIAPENLLKFIRCKCEVNCTRNCSCRKNGLQCVAACKNCHGLCTNSTQV